MSANSSRYYIPVYDLGPSVVNTHDITFQRVSDGLSWKFENSLSYKTTIDKVHNISAMIGTSAEKGGLSGSYMYGVNIDNIFNGLDYAYLSNCPTIYSDGNTVLKGGPWTPSSLSSYYGRIIYDYNSTYLFTAIARRDGSSKFAEGHRWGTFPSFSAGWVISNENFMKQYKWLDFLKIRASWGQNGNQNIPDFQYLSTISNTNCKYSFGIDKNSTTIGSYPDILPNVNVTWETSEQTNIGLDIYCLSNRVSFTFDVYNKTTKNWLVQAPIQAIYGTGAPYINGGDVNNKGIEISLGWKAHISDFKYGISTNYAYNKNKVLRIANESGIIDGPSNVFRTSDEWFRAQVG
jgi:outer membrane receptor protein involved in Fe transport